MKPIPIDLTNYFDRNQRQKGENPWEKREMEDRLLVGITVIYLIVMVVLFHRFRTAMLKLGEEQRRIQAEKKRSAPASHRRNR